MHSSSAPWYSLPLEMTLSILEHLQGHDLKSFSQVDQSAHIAATPFLYREVRLCNYKSLVNFLQSVPQSCRRHVRYLDIDTSGGSCTKDTTDAVISLLSTCLHVQTLSIRMSGAPDKAIIPCFAQLGSLVDLSLCNVGDEQASPLSERLAVSIAATVPRLRQLQLERISRSTLHASECVGVYPYIPLVSGDDDIPEHPVLGSDLNLPSLLRIPTLEKLAIRDTHLGDPRWATTSVNCHLQVLDLGSCYHETEEFNRKCTETIMTAVGRTVDEFSLNTSVAGIAFAKPCDTPLQKLRKLHISPFVPVDTVVDTMSNLAGSPIESLSMQCFEDDVVDACEALREFLTLRVKRGGGFYEKLSKIDVSIASQDDESELTPVAAVSESNSNCERNLAIKRLQTFCRELSLGGNIREETPTTKALDIAGLPRVSSSLHAVRPTRSMSI